MPRSQGQSDFVIRKPVIEQPVRLPDAAGPVDLPKMQLRSPEASARATRIVMTITMIMLAIGAILVAVGPHIPSGE